MTNEARHSVFQSSVETTPASLVTYCAEQLEQATQAACQELDDLAKEMIVICGSANDPATTEALSRVASQLQFIDRFRQQLVNAQRNLRAIAGSLPHGSEALPEATISTLLGTLRSNLTTVQEKQFFDQLFGVPKDPDGDASLPAENIVLFD